jgi:hypothetical protein
VTRKRKPGRPPFPDGTQRTHIAVRLPPATVAKLDRLAEGSTRTAVVQGLIDDAPAPKSSPT